MDEFKVREIVVESVDAAKSILTMMHSKIDTFGFALVQDLYDWNGIDCNYRDHLFGWTTTVGMGYNKAGAVYLMIFPDPTSSSFTESTEKVSIQDNAIKSYAERAQAIYRDRTAGDFTWEGLLSCFLADATRKQS